MVFTVSHAIGNINTVLLDTLSSVLLQISKDYKIDFEELHQKYLEDINMTQYPRRKGRKKKIKDEYIETEEYEYEGVIYLVDGNNIVYSNNVKNPVMLGKRLSDGTITLMSSSLQ